MSFGRIIVEMERGGEKEQKEGRESIENSYWQSGARLLVRNLGSQCRSEKRLDKGELTNWPVLRLDQPLWTWFNRFT